MASSQIAGSTGAQDALRHWQAVHSDSSLQFAPVTIPPPPDITKNPAWLEALGRFLEHLFGPIGRILGLHWSGAQYLLIALALIGVLALAWFWLRPLLRPRIAEEESPGWVPSAQQALGLLADADRLAGEGRYDAATHLLLQRSVHHIADARPDWLHPSSTAREIAGITGLSAPARSAFTAISDLVERSRYALRPLAEPDWQMARAAYARFADTRISA